MKTYVAPSMMASEFDNHDIVSCVSCLIRVFGGGREYTTMRGGRHCPTCSMLNIMGPLAIRCRLVCRFMHWWQICLYQRLPRFDM